MSDDLTAHPLYQRKIDSDDKEVGIVIKLLVDYIHFLEKQVTALQEACTKEVLARRKLQEELNQFVKLPLIKTDDENE